MSILVCDSDKASNGENDSASKMAQGAENTAEMQVGKSARLAAQAKVSAAAGLANTIEDVKKGGYRCQASNG